MGVKITVMSGHIQILINVVQDCKCLPVIFQIKKRFSQIKIKIIESGSGNLLPVVMNKKYCLLNKICFLNLLKIVVEMDELRKVHKKKRIISNPACKWCRNRFSEFLQHFSINFFLRNKGGIKQIEKRMDGFVREFTNLTFPITHELVIP